MKLVVGKWYHIVPVDVTSYRLPPGVYKISAISFVDGENVLDEEVSFSIEGQGTQELLLPVKDYIITPVGIYEDDSLGKEKLLKPFGMNSDLRKLEENLLIMEDAFLISSLLRCGLDMPRIFGLVWGDKICTVEGFPLEIRTLVDDIIQEEIKKKESVDSQEKRLHSVIIDLLWLLYQKCVNEFVDKLDKETKCQEKQKQNCTKEYKNWSKT